MTIERDKKAGLFYLKLGLLFFWACWFTLACSTNIFDFINTMGWLPAGWRFRSGNYALVGGVLDIYHLSPIFVTVLFICNTCIQGLSALLFFMACVCFWQQRHAWRYINYAFALSIGLWAAFLVMEELFIAYAFEGTHTGLLMFELITLLAIHLLPQD